MRELHAECLTSPCLVVLATAPGRPLGQELAGPRDGALRRRIGLTILAPLLVALAVAQPARAGLVVARDSTAGAVVVLPDHPTVEEALAAERLQFYVQEITGVRLEVIREPQLLTSRPAPPARIHIGSTRAASHVLESLEERNAPAEASLVAADGDTTFVTGIDPIGTLHATYFLLEDFGCRLYIPAEWGTIIPRASELVIEDQSTYRAPSFKLRSGLTHATTDLDEDASWAAYEWGRGNHLGGWRWWGGGHSYRFLIPKENMETHPEWFALVNGKRTRDQLCITNPEGRAFALETVRRALVGYGDNPPELICISPDDTRAEGFCQCETCHQLVPTLPDGTKNFREGHDRIIAYANYFAEAVRDDYPNSRVVYYVDYHSQGFPSIATPAPNSAFWAVHWQGDQFHGQDDSTRLGKALTNWGRFDSPMVVYSYWGSHTSWGFWPLVHAMGQDVRHYHNKGVVGLYSETHENWGAQHLNYIVYPRLLWDVNTDVDALIDEFCEKFYGPAAKPMREYYTLLEKAAGDGPPQFKYRQTLIPTFTPAVLSALRQRIQQAGKIVRGQDEVHQKRFAFVRAGFEISDLYFSAEHLMRTYPATKDVTIRPRMVEMMKRVVEIGEDPRFERGLIAKGSIALLGDIKQIYEQYRQGTAFAPGEFRYYEDYYLGGRTFIDAESKVGFVDDQYGLSLDAEGSGTLVYRFDAQAGDFEMVAGSLVLTSPTAVNPLRLYLRTDPDQPWSPAEYTASGATVAFDLSLAARRESSIWLKIELTNASARSAHVLHQLHLNGKVRATAP